MYNIFCRVNAAIGSNAAKYSSDIDEALRIKEAPQVSEVAVLKPEEVKMRKQLEGTIKVQETVCYYKLFSYICFITIFVCLGVYRSS